MSIMISLPDKLAHNLQTRAEAVQLSLDELVTDLLIKLLEPEADDYPTLEEVVARIKATPPNPANIHPPTASLAELLSQAPEDPEFDLETWTSNWDKIEAEMKARDRANDIAEGRA